MLDFSSSRIIRWCADSVKGKSVSNCETKQKKNSKNNEDKERKALLAHLFLKLSEMHTNNALW